MFDCELCNQHGYKRKASVVVLIDTPDGYEGIPLCEVHSNDFSRDNGYGKFTIAQAEALVGAARIRRYSRSTV